MLVKIRKTLERKYKIMSNKAKKNLHTLKNRIKMGYFI